MCGRRQRPLTSRSGPGARMSGSGSTVWLPRYGVRICRTSPVLLIVSYSPVEESAHRLGRVLHTLADAALVDAVVAEVEIEVDAVTRAELGDLSGRAVQAVALDRLDVSPIQVAAADEVLQADPLGGGLLAAAVDPAAACVAAAHWLAAAAVVAGRRVGDLAEWGVRRG